MPFSAKCIRLCLARGLPATLENPRFSRLWLCPPVKSFAICVCLVPLRKKPTGFLSCNLDLSGLDSFVCKACPPGVCARTGKRHQTLSGVNSDGKFWTKVAEPYPMRLCKIIGLAYRNKWMEQTCDSAANFFVCMKPNV